MPSSRAVTPRAGRITENGPAPSHSMRPSCRSAASSDHTAASSRSSAGAIPSNSWSSARVGYGCGVPPWSSWYSQRIAVCQNNSAREPAYGIAQWAINAVDFRDADSIMTPFEFDIDPFTNVSGNPNGWDVDGVLGTGDDLSPERGLVWGCERPELLITEAFAFHARRTEDLNVGGGKTTSATNPDNDFDQRLRPRGSFFLELYNPWAGDDRNPGEFYYDEPTGAWSPGVMLNQVTQGPAVRYPVWRLAIAKGADKSLDPDDLDPARRITVFKRGAKQADLYEVVEMPGLERSVLAVVHEAQHFASYRIQVTGLLQLSNGC